MKFFTLTSSVHLALLFASLLICNVQLLQVLLCVHESTRILYAMKVVPKAKISTQKQVTQILTECSILK